MKIYADITYKAEFDMPDSATDDDVYDMAIIKLRECSPEDMTIDVDMCRAVQEYYGEMM